MFVTAACAIVDPIAETVTWTLAGHDPPVHVGRGAPMSAKPGLPRGPEARTGAGDVTTPIPSGSGLVFFTDGLYEARDPSNGDDEPLTLFGCNASAIPSRA